MKKLIAFSVIFALLTGAVIAQEFSGWAQVGIRNFLGFNGKELTAVGNRDDEEGRKRLDIGMGLSFDNGVAGISLRLKNDGDGTYNDNRKQAIFDLGSGWWRPVEFVKLTIGGINFGRDLDGGDHNHIWWDYEGDGLIGNITGNDKKWNTSNWFGVEIENVADFVTLKFSFLDSAVGADGDLFAKHYTERFVAQAVFDLDDLGTVGLTFDNARTVFVADYRGNVDIVALKAAFGVIYDKKNAAVGAEWGLSLQADTTIEGISLMARFNSNEFKTNFLRVQAGYNISGIGLSAWVESANLENIDNLVIGASANYVYEYNELDFFDVKIVPKIEVGYTLANNGEFSLKWEAPITLTKSIDGFDFNAAIKFQGQLAPSGDAFKFTIPVTFKYTF